MASTLQHLTIARRINDVYFNFKGNELSEFLLGSIVCDAPKKDIVQNISTGIKLPDVLERKSERAYTHYLRPSINETKKAIFINKKIANIYGYESVDDKADSIICYEQFCPMIKYFVNKYYDYLKEPFMKGYLTHLLTDKVYFTEVVPTIVKENEGEIKDYINEKYNKYGYKKKDYLTNAEYLDWSHDALYGVFDDYSYLSLFEIKDDFPNLSELGDYLETWEKTDRDFKPSMVEDLNGSEAIITFLKNPRISSLIIDAKNQLNEGNIVKRKGLSVKGKWSYELFLDFGEKVENEVENYIDLNKKNVK